MLLYDEPLSTLRLQLNLLRPSTLVVVYQSVFWDIQAFHVNPSREPEEQDNVRVFLAGYRTDLTERQGGA